MLGKEQMPRKNKQIDGRRRRDDLRTLDKNSKEYWEEVLRREGLGMTAGQNTHRMVYVGSTSELEGVSEGVRATVKSAVKRVEHSGTGYKPLNNR